MAVAGNQGAGMGPRVEKGVGSGVCRQQTLRTRPGFSWNQGSIKHVWNRHRCLGLASLTLH